MKIIILTLNRSTLQPITNPIRGRHIDNDKFSNFSCSFAAASPVVDYGILDAADPFASIADSANAPIVITMPVLSTQCLGLCMVECRAFNNETQTWTKSNSVSTGPTTETSIQCYSMFASARIGAFWVSYTATSTIIATPTTIIETPTVSSTTTPSVETLETSVANPTINGATSLSVEAPTVVTTVSEGSSALSNELSLSSRVASTGFLVASKLTVKLALDFASAVSSLDQFKTNFTMTLSKAFSVPQDRFEVTVRVALHWAYDLQVSDIRQGSVIVDFLIKPSVSGPTPAALAVQIVVFASDSASMLSQSLSIDTTYAVVVNTLTDCNGDGNYTAGCFTSLPSTTTNATITTTMAPSYADRAQQALEKADSRMILIVGIVGGALGKRIKISLFHFPRISQ